MVFLVLVEFKFGVLDYSLVYEFLGELFDLIIVSKIKIVFFYVDIEIYFLFIK